MGIRDYIKAKKQSIKENLQLAQEEKSADKARFRMARSEAREARRQEKEKQIVEVARSKEQARTQRKKDYYKAGGEIGKIGRSLKSSNKRPRRSLGGGNLLSSNRINMGLSRDIVGGGNFKPMMGGTPRKKSKKKSRRIIINL